MRSGIPIVLVLGGLLMAGGLVAPARAQTASEKPALSERARAWLSDHAPVIRSTARHYKVDPWVAATVVATELDRRTLVDDFEEDYVRGLLRDKDDRFFERLARAFVAPAAEDPDVGTLDRMLYVTSVGPAQVQVRLALEMESRVAAARKKPPRPLRALLQALLDDEGCLHTVCAILRHAADAYRRHAGLEIGSDPGALATAYNQGSPVTRARQLKKSQGDAVTFKDNEMGRYAEAVAPQVRTILDRSKPPGR